MDRIVSFFLITPTPPSLHTMLWGLFVILAVYTTIHAAILAYHWHAYNIASPTFKRRTLIIYFAGISIFLLLILTSLLSLLA